MGTTWRWQFKLKNTWSGLKRTSLQFRRSAIENRYLSTGSFLRNNERATAIAVFTYIHKWYRVSMSNIVMIIRIIDKLIIMRRMIIAWRLYLNIFINSSQFKIGEQHIIALTHKLVNLIKKHVSFNDCFVFFVIKVFNMKHRKQNLNY